MPRNATARSGRPVGNPTAAAMVWAITVTAVCIALILSSGGIGASVGGADLFGYLVPKYEAVTRALFVEHRLPLWNPYEFNGLPLLGSHQAATFYPMTWIAFGLFSTHAALQIFYAAHFFIFAWGAISYLQRHRIAPPASLVAVVISIAAAFTCRTKASVDHPSFIAALAWVPAVLLFWEKSLESLRPWLGWLAVAVAAQWLGGYPDFSLSTPLLCGVFAIVGTSDRHVNEAAPAARDPTILGRSLLLASGLALGGLLAAIQLIPTAEASLETGRLDGGPEYARLRDYFLLASIDQLPQWTIERVGVGAVALAVAAILRPDRARMAWLAGLTLTIFIGAPPLRWIYDLPVFSGIRFPLAWDLLGGVMWGFLAGAGIASGLHAQSRILQWTTTFLAAWVTIAALQTIREAPISHSQKPPSIAKYAERAEYLSLLQSRIGAGRTRIFSPADAATGTPLRHKLYFVGGYEPAVPPVRVTNLLEAGFPGSLGQAHEMPVRVNPRLASLMGVGVTIASSTSAKRLQRAGFELAGTLPPSDVVLHQAPIPRARIAYKPIYASNPETALALTVDPERDMRATVVVEERLSEEFTLGRESMVEWSRAEITTSEPERVVVEAKLSRPGLVVLTDTFSKSWTAKLDGRPTPILTADYAFRAVAVPKGEHTITFEFPPRAALLGAGVSLMASLITGAIICCRTDEPIETGPTRRS